ncbi:hypothetical protein [Streptomyces sp. NRRL F-5122]|uniref:hypothetical protein n=1 Tax=Streptomyces sp. NRRL F-5122 TaxID=1609098 RepID=UPI00131EADF1|nr:hypothetical protein [Streptomyces sp. NRRL F-5122]
MVWTVWSVVCFLVNLPGGYSWHYFATGAALLFDGGAAGAPSGGLHLYAHYPGLQIGPVTFVVAEVLRVLPPTAAQLAAQTVMMALGPFILVQLRSATRILRPSAAETRAMRVTALVAGCAFSMVWASVAVYYAHLDDALALFLTVLALRALAEGAPALAGICLGLACDAKPWALVFAPLLWTAARGQRRYAATSAVAVVTAAWLPFIIADFGTLQAASYTIVNVSSSALRALGVSDPQTPPWDRAGQLLLGSALGALAIRRRHWQAVLLLGVSARLLLDPEVYDYYTAGLLLGTLSWELLGLQRPRPWWTLGSFVTLYLAPRLLTSPAVLGQIRLWTVVVLAASSLTLATPSCALDSPSRRLEPPG